MLELLINTLKEEIPRRWTVSTTNFYKVSPIDMPLDLLDDMGIVIKGRKMWYSLFYRVLGIIKIIDDQLEIATTMENSIKIDLNSPFIDPVKEILKFIKEN